MAWISSSPIIAQFIPGSQFLSHPTFRASDPPGSPVRNLFRPVRWTLSGFLTHGESGWKCVSRGAKSLGSTPLMGADQPPTLLTIHAGFNAALVFWQMVAGCARPLTPA